MATIRGNESGNVLLGTDAPDSVFGMGGNDVLYGGLGADRIDGGSGIDIANYLDSTVGVQVNLETNSGQRGTAEGDTFVSIESLTGSSHDDFLVGDAGANALRGVDGNDTLKGGGGADEIDGGWGDDLLKGGGGADFLRGGFGTDTADYRDSPSAVYISLVANTASGGDAAGDTFDLVENLTGSGFDDSLRGDQYKNVLQGGAGKDHLYGEGGNDTLYGGIGDDTLYGMDGLDTLHGEDGHDVMTGNAGNDALFGGAGHDRLTGGSGVDAFYFTTALNIASNIDIITDFTVADQDAIVLENAIFTQLVGSGSNLAAYELRIGPAAADADDRIIYDNVTGAMYYDADGNGATNALQFASLTPGLALTHFNFIIV